MITLINSNHTCSSQGTTSPLISEHRQDTSIPLHPSPVATTVIPYNVPHTESCQAVKVKVASPNDSTESSQDQHVFGYQFKPAVTTYVIGKWIIRESLEPIQPKGKKSASSMKQKPHLFFDESNVHQWNIDQVCAFFRSVLGENGYTSLIKEHLIDGIVLLLLEDKHLMNTFQMPLNSRLKVIKRINELRCSDFSIL